jgi:sRNA-binding protein
MHEGIARLAELYPNCFRQPRQPLKIGIHNDVIARHPELRPSLIASALKTYTRSVGYLEALTAGTPRIDLEGNVAGEVTATDEEDAKRKIGKEAGRAAAKAIVPPVTQGASQVEHVAPSLMEPRSESAPVADLPSSPVAAALQPTVPAGQGRLGLAGLKAAAQARRARLVAAK